MENFKVSQGKWREYDVKVTLQSGAYKGSFIFQIDGNVSPYDALKHLDPGCDPVEPIKNNCCYAESEKDNGDYWFEAILIDKEGNLRRIEEERCFLGDYIVGLEVIDCRNYKI